MRQMTFTSIGFQAHHKQTRRERFLSEMETVVPWRELCSLIEPHYPSGQRGRPPIGIERMLRIYFLQQWFNMSDPQAEDCLYDSEAMRKFVGIDLGVETAPDETTRSASYLAFCTGAFRAVSATRDLHGYMIGVTANVRLLARVLTRLRLNELFSIFLELVQLKNALKLKLFQSIELSIAIGARHVDIDFWIGLKSERSSQCVTLISIVSIFILCFINLSRTRVGSAWQTKLQSFKKSTRIFSLNIPTIAPTNAFAKKSVNLLKKCMYKKIRKFRERTA